MGGFCTSKPQVTNQTQTYTPDPVVAAAGHQAIGMAQSASQQPFQMPAAPVAGFNPFQQQSFNQVLGMQGSLEDRAGANLRTAQAPITQQDIEGLENPYADQVMGDIKKYIFDPQRVQTMGQSTAQAGGVGADRLGLVSGNLDKTQGDILAQARSGFYTQALQAAQQAKQQALASAQGWQNLQTGNLQATNALGMVGTQQQQQQQTELMSPYQQILAQIAYPYQQAQFLAGITGGLGGALGGTTAGQGTTTPSQPSMFNQIAGVGAMAAGAAGAFNGMGGDFGATSTPNSPNASMYTGDPTSAGFGPTYYAKGGAVDDDDQPSLSPVGDLNPIPRLPLKMTSGQFHNNLNLNPPSGGSSSSGLGDIAKMASAVLPLLLDRGGSVAGGGAVNPWDVGKGFAGGGDTEGLTPIPEIPLQATSGESHNNLNLNPPAPSGGGSGGGGDMAAAAMKMLPMLLLKKGGSVPRGYASDGFVNEYTEDQYNPIDFRDQISRGGNEDLLRDRIDAPFATYNASPDYSRPIERPAPSLGMWPFNRGQADYKGDVTMFPQSGSAPGLVGSAQAAPSPPGTPTGDPASILRAEMLKREQTTRQQHTERPIQAGFAPGEPVPATALTVANAPARSRTPFPDEPVVATGSDRTGGYPNRGRLAGVNSDMKVSDFQTPAGQRPYPDATTRDWGQRAARSPWMALIEGGAKMMQSTKSGIAGLGEGAQAGIAHLDSQRKELRSEEQINQRADELYRHAVSEVNRYTRMTPAELATERYRNATLESGRFQPVNYSDPVSGETQLGSYNAKTGQLFNAVTKQLVTGNARILPRGAGMPMTEAQLERAAKDRFVNNPGLYKDIKEAKDAIEAEEVAKRGQSGATQKPLRAATDDELNQAKAAIAAGKDPNGVRAVLKSKGIDPSGLD